MNEARESGPRFMGLVIPGSRFRAPRNDFELGAAGAGAPQIWHGRCYCGIKKASAGITALS